MIRIDQLYNLIERTLKEYSLHSGNVAKLTLGTFLMESNGGDYLRQVPKGEFDINVHALGFGQMEKNTFDWLNDKYDFFIYEKTDREPNSNKIEFEELEYNIKYMILFARLRYLSVPHPLPDTLAEMASYWNTYYNCNPKYGTDEEFINKYEKYVKDIL